MIWPLFAYRRRGRRIDPGPAIPSADRSGRDFAVGKGAVAAARAAGGRRPSWLTYCNVRFSPGRISQGRTAWRGASRPDSGRPARRHRISRWVDRVAAAGLTEPRCASERGLAMGGGRPAERRFTVGGSGKSVARCHRAVLAYWKFESISLQRRVCKLSVPREHAPTSPPSIGWGGN